ncbi:MAG TPA: AbrB family transcriptional regulator [Candidatus Rokubacteria bacterium]|nr:MAG: hypothetical protein A2X53_19560 [Candidatus Rokubacteria bacterium GWA2_70_23]OGK90060.1 MAG: hypothetical protein A2X50_08105 [Candidatus Rokubacteria bacterium GWF2_70_14]HAM54253.1 AbrB family transcriptional regulator [Candidatus Rokubacteria bacterium]
MTRKRKAEAPRVPAGTGAGCCRVASMVTVDHRGQMVLPKDLRDRAGIRAGDKMVLVSWERDGQVHCLFLLKAEKLTAMLGDLLGPVLRGATTA